MARRARRWELRSKLRPITSLKRVRACGKVTTTGTGGPTVRVAVDEGRVRTGYAGLSTCGSVWACPRCCAKVAFHRAGEVADVMKWALHQGGSAALITLTLRHHAGDALRPMLEAASYAWSKVTSGKQWVAEKQRLGGIHGWVRVLEITRGSNGWHPHFHILLLTEREVELDEVEAMADGMFRRWAAALGRKGYQAFRDLGGLDVRMASLDNTNLADYFMKLAREVTSGYAKHGRGSSRTPFQLAWDAVETYREDDITAWWEYEAATRGRRQLTWSQGLRKRVLMDREKTDEEIAQEAEHGEDALLLDGDTWGALVDTPGQTELLDEGEQQRDMVAAVVAMSAYLDRKGLTYRLVSNVKRAEEDHRAWRRDWVRRRYLGIPGLDDPPSQAEQDMVRAALPRWRVSKQLV